MCIRDRYDVMHAFLNVVGVKIREALQDIWERLVSTNTNFLTHIIHFRVDEKQIVN